MSGKKGMKKYALRWQSVCNKDLAPSVTPSLVASVRSAGSYEGFRGVPRWDQNWKNDINFAVVIPKSLLLEENNEGIPKIEEGFGGKGELVSHLTLSRSSHPIQSLIHCEDGAGCAQKLRRKTKDERSKSRLITI